MHPDQPTLSELTDIFLLESVKGFGPQKFKILREEGLKPGDVIASPREMQRFGKKGIEFRNQVEALGAKGRLEAEKRARKQLDMASLNGGAILTYDSSFYPKVLYNSNTPVAALYARGDYSVLKYRQAVACVGSRNIREPYSQAHNQFAINAAAEGFVVVSGFATGADIIGHLAATEAGGQTICVMPSGLDRPFPPEHREIWHRFNELPGAVFVSEFGFGVGANALNLRKRNKMIAGCALGVLVSQSAEDGGAMNAYRFAIEQKKPVATFEFDGTKDTTGNDLIAGSADRVRASVLPLRDKGAWSRWLQTL